MASIFLDSSAVGLNDGTTKVDAFTTLHAAVLVWVPGDVIQMSHLHSEVPVGDFPVPSGGPAFNYDPIIIRSISFVTDSITASVAPQITRPTLYRAQSYATFIGCNLLLFGIWESPGRVNFDSCVLQLTSISYASRDSKVWRNTQITLAPSSRDLQTMTTMHIVGGSWGGSTTTIGAFTLTSQSYACDMLFDGVDLTTYVPTMRLLRLNNVSGDNARARVKFINCRNFPIVPDATFFNGTQGDVTVELINTDPGGNLNHYRKIYPLGSSVKSDYVISLIDGFGTAASEPQSHVVVTSADINAHRRVTAPKMTGFFSTTGIKTLDFEFTHDYTSPLTRGEVVIDMSTKLDLGSAGFTVVSSMPVDGDYEDTTPCDTSVASWAAPRATLQRIRLVVDVQTVGHYTAEASFGMYEAGRFLNYNPTLVES